MYIVAMTFLLPKLPYDHDALEPYIDTRTMEIHHTKHHAAYVNNLNAALEGTERLTKPIEEVLQSIDQLPQDKQTAVRNNGGGHYNHSFFRQLMSPKPHPMSTHLEGIIMSYFETIDNFKEKFAAAAMGRFGSGRARLIKENDGSLTIMSTSNQDSPVMEGKKPILWLDVREHAYYLKYQNLRADYIKNRRNVVDRKRVEEHYEEA